jgi:hypothetical protein
MLYRHHRSLKAANVIELRIGSPEDEPNGASARRQAETADVDDRSPILRIEDSIFNDDVGQVAQRS